MSSTKRVKKNSNPTSMHNSRFLYFIYEFCMNIYYLLIIQNLIQNIPNDVNAINVIIVNVKTNQN